MLSRCLLAAAVGVAAMAGVVVGQSGQLPGQQTSQTPYSVIYTDWTTGWSVGLPTQSAVSPDTTYNTNLVKSFRFGVDWAGDQDTVTINPPYSQVGTGNFVIANENPNNTDCSLVASGSGQFPLYIIVLSANNSMCNYTVSWSVPFTNDALVVSYKERTIDDEIQVNFLATTITGDPQFVGLRGQQYQVHGIDGAVYNIITEQALQVNSRFAFLTEGQCPMLQGKPDTNCWSHPGSYLGEMSFQQLVDGKLHAALVTAGPAASGFAGVQVDGKALQLGATVSFGSFQLTFRTAHSVHVRTAHFEFELSNSDMFINQQLRATVQLSQLHAHGLLGQTASSTTYPTAIKYIAGAVDDYAIADGDIFGTDFVYNLFNKQ